MDLSCGQVVLVNRIKKEEYYTMIALIRALRKRLHEKGTIFLLIDVRSCKKLAE